MNRKKLWLGAAAAVAVLTLGATTFASADSTTPTQQEALDGLATAQKYIQQHPDTPLPTTAPPTTTPAASTNPANFSATAGDQKIVLKWAKPLGGTPTGYIYGRNGVDNTGFGAWTSDVQPTTLLTVTLDKLVNGTPYTVFVEAVYSTGNKRVSATVTPNVVVTPTTTTSVPTTTTTTPTVPPTTTTAPPGNRVSGLPWNSGVWNDQDATQTARFVSGPRGGRAVDNILVYTSRNNLASENAPAAWRAALPANFNGVNQDLVLALTSWTSDGAFMTNAQAQAIGTSLCSVDGTAPIVRLDWEMNLNGGAGDNGADLTSSNYTAWVARFRAVATGIKATCASARIDFNPNHGADQTPGCNSGTYAAPNNCTRRAFQSLKDVIDIFGIDTYDSYPPVTASNGGWGYRVNASNFNELENSRVYALANGKKWSVPEWGVACNVSNCQWQGNAGGDNVLYPRNMIAYFAAHAADVAYETYFNDPNSYIVSDLIDNNPLSRAEYRSDLLAL